MKKLIIMLLFTSICVRSVAQEELPVAVIKIAYVQLDELIDNYTMYQDLLEEFTQKTNSKIMRFWLKVKLLKKK